MSQTQYAKVLLDDSARSSFLINTFRVQQKERVKSIRINDLFTYLKEIQKLNPTYSTVNCQNDPLTFLFCSPKSQIPSELTGENISLLHEKFKRNIPHQVQGGHYPREYFEMMKKMERLCCDIGKLKAFYFHDYCECHLGGFENSLYAFGIDGLFVLVFFSQGEW